MKSDRHGWVKVEEYLPPAGQKVDWWAKSGNGRICDGVVQTTKQTSLVVTANAGNWPLSMMSHWRPLPHRPEKSEKSD